MTDFEKLFTTDCVTVEDYKERLDELRQEQEDLMKKLDDPRPAIRSAEEVNRNTAILRLRQISLG